MSGFSKTTDNKVLNLLFTGAALPTPEKHWALFKSENGLTENNPAAWNEVTGAGYARVKSENADFITAVNSFTQNNKNVEFPVAAVDWGTITHVAVMDAATAGNVIAWGIIRNPVTMEVQPRIVYASDQFVIRANTSTFHIIDSVTI